MLQGLVNGWHLAQQSFSVLRADKKLLLFPALSGLACLAVTATFVVPLWTGGELQRLAQENRQIPDDPLLYLFLFLFYFANYLVIIYFNAALIACAILRLSGQEASLSDGIEAANARLPQIIAWAFVSATVGVILAAIESRNRRVGRAVSGIIGGLWSAATYFVVPVLVVERVGPLGAVSRSLGVIRKTWGQAVGANCRIGVYVSLAAFVAAIPAAAAIMLQDPTAMAVGITVSGVLLIGVMLVANALKSINVAALYLYAAHGRIPQQFDEQALVQAFHE